MLPPSLPPPLLLRGLSKRDRTTFSNLKEFVSSNE
ncbi:unnamed protein product, partial [Rotaria sp. Silwood1]